jgi:hypothetical protein
MIPNSKSGTTLNEDMRAHRDAWHDQAQPTEVKSMWLLSDNWLFPILQAVLLGWLIWFIRSDKGVGSKKPSETPMSSLRASADVIRGDLSMKKLGTTAGFAAAIATLINSTALKEGMWLKNYSVLFNVVDVSVILYLCFGSRTSREWILGTFEHARID